MALCTCLQLNKYGDSAWTYDAERGQCYYHYLLPTQPDLNYNNNEVKAAMMVGPNSKLFSILSHCMQSMPQCHMIMNVYLLTEVNECKKKSL